MRQLVSLFLTASFLFLGQGVQASSIDDDNSSVVQGAAVTAVTAVTSSASQDLKCYYTVDGKRKRLFGHRGNLRDKRIPVGDPSVPTVVTSQPSQEQSESVDKTCFETLFQHVGLASLHFDCQLKFFQYLDPKAQNHLLQTCRYYRAFAQPVAGQEHAVVSHDLRIDLLMTIIAKQSGDFDLFMNDQQSTFRGQPSDDKEKARNFKIQRIAYMSDEIASGYYKGTLSLNTEHGKTYRGTLSADTSMGTLSLRNKGLRLVPLKFPKASRIRTLDLSNNQLKVAPDLSGLTNLMEITLFNNQLTDAPVVSGLPKLKELVLSNNQLKAAPVLTGLTNLQTLDLSNNQITAAPVVSGLPKLWSLYLNNNQLSAAPVVSGLTNLSKLDLADNQLTDAPVLTGLTDLRELALYNNQLKVAPDVSELTNLTELYLSNNQLTAAPVVTGLTWLWSLYLNNNQLSAAPVVSGLTNLSKLDLADNRLITAPVVSELPNLKELYLSRNRITTPLVLTGLPNLERLYLNNNQLSAAPVLTGLEKLEMLSLDSNLCDDANYLETLRVLNKGRGAFCRKISLYAISKDDEGNRVETFVSLN